MPEAQLTPAQTPVKTKQNPLAVVHSIARLAGPLSALALRAAMVAWAAGASVWILSFAPYVFDSLKSAFLCTLVLVLASGPGTVFFWLYTTLRSIAALPTQVEALRTIDPEALQETVMVLADPGGTSWYKRLWVRVRTLIAMRGLIDLWSDDFVRIAGMARDVAILVHPFTAVVVLLAAVLTATLAIGAVLKALWMLIAAAF